MKISKRENFLLGILIALLIIFAYYQFIYTNQVEKLNKKREEKTQIEEKYNGVMKDIGNLDNIEEDLKALKVSISDKAEKLYPIIMQEKIIIEIDKLLNDSKLSGNIAFSPIEVSVVESMKAEEIEKAESSLKELVDEYEGDETSSGKSTNNEVDGESTESSSENIATSEQLKIAINFNGSYENLKNFISAVEKYDRKIVITNISITANSQDNLSGVMNLEFHAVPKLSGEDEEYLEWTLKNVYGKDILFSSSEATGAYSSTIEEQNNEEDLKDFVMMLRTPSSELPTLTMGKAKDDLRESYIYSDNEKTEEVEITFDEIDGKTYFKYNASSSYYPKDESSYGKEFTPKSKYIVVEILSENRNGDSDNSGIKLSIINNTSKNVEVIIEDDDTFNPRVSVISKGNTVNITKK